MSEKAAGDETASNDGQPVKSEESASEEIADEEHPTSFVKIPSSETRAASNDRQAVSKGKATVDILLKATGNAPIMKQRRWSVKQDDCIGRISDFVRKYLKLDPDERLFLYVNQTFAPAPDQTVKNLYECYGADGKLILHYCKSQAWG